MENTNKGEARTMLISINQNLYDAANREAKKVGRTTAEQIQFWAKLGRAAIQNPDLPASFIANCLDALAEQAGDAIPYSIKK
ncbi:MAG: hypothetical protein U1D69_08665 [Polynucleobacter sp.]|nr:hypothetical protein [Polynucleobacter sp.]